MDNTKVRRSGYPRDLREEGPCGEVKTHWQPEAFTLIKKLKEEGWPVPGRLPCRWDTESGMLVARKPISSEGNKADGRG